MIMIDSCGTVHFGKTGKKFNCFKQVLFCSPGALTATYTLTVTISDVNDEPPTCSQTVYVATASENGVIGFPVTQLVCSDDDATATNNAISTYTISSGNTGMLEGILAVLL